MKRNLLTIFSVFSALVLNAQDTWVTGTANVYVAKNTMFYHGGILNIKDGASGTIINQGLVYVKNQYYHNHNPFGTNEGLVMETDIVGTNDYAQLITSDTSWNAGHFVYVVPYTNHTGALQVSLPLMDYKIEDYATNTNLNLTGNTPCPIGVFCPTTERRKHPLFTWSNTNLRWDPVQAGATINPHLYHIVNTASTVSGANLIPNDTFKHTGVPNGGHYMETVPNTSSISFGAGGVGANVYGIRYRTYIDDFIDGTPTSAGKITNWSDPAAGRYQIQLGNPYACNLDLSYIGITETGTPDDANDLNVKGVWYYTTSRTIGGTGTTDTGGTTAVVALTDALGRFVAGDINKLIIRPMRPFVIKGDAGFVGQSFAFNDGIKTFKHVSKAAEYGANGPAGTYTKWGTEENPDVYQVELKLNDKNGEVGLGTFVTVADEYETGLETDPSNGYDKISSCIYGLPESKNGGVDVDQYTTGKQIYINKIHPTFKGKSIPLGVKVGNYTEELTLKANLYDTGRKLKETEAGFTNPNAKFYFHDKKLGTYSEITPSFTYTFKETDSNDNRFELFYGEIENLSSENLDVAKSGTIVYKNQSDSNFYVKFAKTWNTASVKIYDIAGALISSVSNVDASVDYLLPISQSGAYVVTSVSDLGEVSTSKIVK